MGRAIARLAVPRVLLGAVVAGLVLVASGQDAGRGVPAKATADGNYSGLLRKVEVPQDRKTYGDFFEGGYFPELPAYEGYRDLPAGHWVYVSPHWYIWKDSKVPREPAAVEADLMARNDPFVAMQEKDVEIHFFGGEVLKGRIAENRASYVLVTTPGSKQRAWVNKGHVSSIRWEDEADAR